MGPCLPLACTTKISWSSLYGARDLENIQEHSKNFQEHSEHIHYLKNIQNIHGHTKNIQSTRIQYKNNSIVIQPKARAQDGALSPSSLDSQDLMVQPLGARVLEKTFKSIQKHSRTFKKHSLPKKTFKNIHEHTKNIQSTRL